MNNKFIKKSGQIMVETMVALSMVVIAMLGMLSLLSSALGINKVVSNQYIASYLASEGIEIVKNIVDSNSVLPGQEFNHNLTKCENGCAFQYDSISALGYDANSTPLRFDNSTGIYSYYTRGKTTPFYRIIKITPSQDLGWNEIEVQSIVKWKSRGGVDEEIKLEDRFYNWR